MLNVRANPKSRKLTILVKCNGLRNFQYLQALYVRHSLAVSFVVLSLCEVFGSCDNNRSPQEVDANSFSRVLVSEEPFFDREAS